jgi:polyhydroxyalkanoate synthesis regulator phasin
MARLIERSLLLGLGALTLTRDKVNHFVDKLIEEGEVKPEEAPGIVDKLVTRGEEEREELRKLVRQELDRVLPTSRHGIEELNSKMDDLAAQIEELTGKKPTKKEAA